MNKRIFVFLIGVLLMLFTVTTVMAQEGVETSPTIADVKISGDVVNWEPRVSYEGLLLRTCKKTTLHIYN